jgi:SAM-dependent methyltransferase
MESDARAAEWHLAHRAREPSFRRQAAAAVSELPSGDAPVLDLACGSAPLAPFLRAAGHRHVGLERDGEMIRAAIRRPEAGGLVLADAHGLPFRDGHFKAVVALGLFEYLSDPAVVLAEAVRVTAPGGVLLLTVPRRESLYRRGLAAAAPILRMFGREDPFDLESGRAVTPADAARWGRLAGVPLVAARPVAPALVPWPFDRMLRDPSRPLPDGLGTAWMFRYSCPARPGRRE